MAFLFTDSIHCLQLLYPCRQTGQHQRRSLCNASPAFWTVSDFHDNGDLQTLICVLVARPRRCSTLSKPVPRQKWMAAYLGYTLRMKTLFRDWPVMVHDTHTRRRRRQSASNHGVRDPNLRWILTAGQCLSRSVSMDVSYSCASSSAEESCSTWRSVQSWEAFRSASNALRESFLHDRLVVQKRSTCGFLTFNVKVMNAWSDNISPTCVWLSLVSLLVITKSSVWPAILVCGLLNVLNAVEWLDQTC